MSKVLKWLDVNIEPVLMAIIFYAMMGLVTLQVILRFAFRAGFSWGEEVARFMFVWLVYFSISYAARNHRHIRITFIVNLLGEKAHKVINILVDVLFLGFVGIILNAAIKITESIAKYGDMAVTVQISMNVIYLAGVVGFVMMGVRIIQAIVWKIKHFNAPLTIFLNSNGLFSGADEICLTRSQVDIDGMKKEKEALLDEEKETTTYTD